MKPKILCAHCNAPLQPENQFCSSCGVAVDWTTEIVSGSSKKMRTEPSISRVVKYFFGVIVIAALAVIGYEFSIDKKPKTGSTPQVSDQPMTFSEEMIQKQAEIQALERDVHSHPENMALVLQLANSLHDGLLYEKAIPYYKMFLDKNPSDANARVDLGICYKELRNYSEAKKEMMEALKFVPKHLHAHFNLGIVCLSEGNIQEADEWFKKTVALDPSSEIGKRAQQLLTQHNSQTSKTN